MALIKYTEKVKNSPEDYDLYFPKTLAEQVLTDATRRFVSDADINKWNNSTRALFTMTELKPARYWITIKALTSFLVWNSGTGAYTRYTSNGSSVLVDIAFTSETIKSLYIYGDDITYFDFRDNYPATFTGTVYPSTLKYFSIRNIASSPTILDVPLPFGLEVYDANGTYNKDSGPNMLPTSLKEFYKGYGTTGRTIFPKFPEPTGNEGLQVLFLPYNNVYDITPPGETIPQILLDDILSAIPKRTNATQGVLTIKSANTQLKSLLESYFSANGYNWRVALD